MSDYTPEFFQDTIEEWRDVPGYEGFYQVSNIGRVRGVDRVVERGGRPMQVRARIIRPYFNHKGYVMVRLHMNETETNWEVHRLVSRAFLGPLPKGHHAHHRSEDRTDNRVENLVYLSIADHTSVHHTGERAAGSRLTTANVLEIKELLEQGRYTHKYIGTMYGVDRKTISDIAQGKTWMHLDKVAGNQLSTKANP